MSITTDSLITVESSGVTYDTVGLSKTLNNYTAADIWDYVFCSANSNSLYHISYGSGGMNYYTYQGNDNYVPFELRYAATNHNNFYYHPRQTMNNPDGLYMRVIWLQRTSNGSDNYITSGNGSKYKLITMFNAPHYVYECNAPRLVDNTHGSTSWNAGSYLYYSDGGSLYYYDDVTSETPTRILINRVVPAIIFKDKNNKVYIIPYKQNISIFTSVQNTQSSGWNPSTANNFYDFTGANCIAFPVVINTAYQYCNDTTGVLTSPYSDGSRLPEGSGIYSRPMYATTTINHLISFFGCGGSNLTLGFTVNNYFRDVENCKKFFSLAGLHFKADKIYKPIIEGGYVTGFTDQLSTISDLDNWDGKTKHDVPQNPPAPSERIQDKEHEMPLAYIGGNAGMVTFYEINKTGLASADDISDAISRFDITQIGKDLLRNFISFKAFAAIRVDDTVDRQIKIAGIGLEDSGGNALTGRVIGGVKPIDLFPTSGGVTIPTLYNDYRDYEPYTRIQMYVPFCGWFSLPSWCIGKKITGTMFTDLYNGTVKAVIYASDTVVAEVGGCCAYDIPFVADATGAKASAVISSALTTAAAVGATVSMPNVATGIATVSAAANLAATLNGNDTTLKGVLGDGSNLNGLLHVYIKVSRPMSPNGSTNIPDSYKHEIGIPTMKEVKISAGDGYIQVMDAKVTGNMTAREKQMIIDGFRHGLNF